VRVGMMLENPHEPERQFPQEGTARTASLLGGGCAQLSRSDRVLVCGRSGARLSGTWARQGSASPLRALDPPGTFPMLLQLPERRQEWFDSGLAHQPFISHRQSAASSRRPVRLRRFP
jgi:hypothetical protein